MMHHLVTMYFVANMYKTKAVYSHHQAGYWAICTLITINSCYLILRFKGHAFIYSFCKCFLYCTQNPFYGCMWAQCRFTDHIIWTEKNKHNYISDYCLINIHDLIRWLLTHFLLFVSVIPWNRCLMLSLVLIYTRNLFHGVNSQLSARENMAILNVNLLWDSHLL